MIATNSISDVMSRIRSIHEDAQLFAASEQNDNALIAYLEATDTQFRSIAYEGAAMSRGLLDISLGDTLPHWTAYMDRTKPHSVQVHIGLGWALAQRQVPLNSYLQSLSPIMQARVLDGYGYYDGMFRNRTSVRDKVIPEVIKGTDLHAYDQGVGRSLWYIAKGDLIKLNKLIEGFDDSRKADLWRGIGIASAYVGGCDESMLQSLWQEAGAYQRALAAGAVFLAHSRDDASTINEETELTCRTWCKLSAAKVVALMDQAHPDPATTSDSYIRWVKAIEERLRNIA